MPEQHRSEVLPCSETKQADCCQLRSQEPGLMHCTLGDGLEAMRVELLVGMGQLRHHHGSATPSAQPHTSRNQQAHTYTGAAATIGHYSSTLQHAQHFSPANNPPALRQHQCSLLWAQGMYACSLSTCAIKVGRLLALQHCALHCIERTAYCPFQQKWLEQQASDRY